MTPLAAFVNRDVSLPPFALGGPPPQRVIPLSNPNAAIAVRLRNSLHWAMWSPLCLNRPLARWGRLKSIDFLRGGLRFLLWGSGSDGVGCPAEGSAYSRANSRRTVRSAVREWLRMRRKESVRVMGGPLVAPLLGNIRGAQAFAGSRVAFRQIPPILAPPGSG